MRTALVVLTFCLVGCSGKSLQLDPIYAPLERVEEDPTHLLIPSNVVTTIGSVTYTDDLASWETDNPPGPQRDAKLQHERLHTIQQSAMGVIWFARYVAEPSFRWSVEQPGWHIELLILRNAGARIVPEQVASILAGSYVVAGAPMIDYDAALVWVKKELSGGL